ncbi:MAG TPA: DUF4105 domain-containing protein [Gemmatimonadaceae bacterium]|nr:DUF4105 domain-containing protein [Gemmatimonadaceae bacterium]
MRPRKLLRWSAAALTVMLLTPVAIVWLGRWGAGPASATRDWALDHSVAPRIEFRGDSATIYGFRRFAHDTGGRYSARWDTTAVDLSRLDRVWFVLAPFGREWTGTAHSFVTFGFGDSTFVSISVEARRERGETFGMWAGLTHQLELLYVIGDENDIIRQRIIGAGYDLYLYPVATTRERARAMFVAMLQRAEKLRTNPEYYDLFSSNCTSNLIDHVNSIVPGRIPRGIATLLPGYSDKVAVEIGLIDAKGNRDSLRHQFRINDVVKSLPDDANFAKALRAAMK